MGRDAGARSGQTLTLQYLGESITYQVQFRARQTLTIEVHPDQRVMVVAPLEASLAEVVVRVERRAGWIAKQRRYFDRFHPLPPHPEYVSGETHRYLGRQYRLKVVPDRQESVKLVGRFLHISVQPDGGPGRVEHLLTRWYRIRARDVFSRRLLVCLQSARSLGLELPTITVRKMVRRWGSCTGTGRILLNLDLVKAPITCIDYVIMHELCHLRVHDHSTAFYRLLTRCMPDWEDRKRRLESIVVI
jgi:predicted metal-dependent hydrolase